MIIRICEALAIDKQPGTCGLKGRRKPGARCCIPEIRIGHLRDGTDFEIEVGSGVCLQRVHVL